MEINIVFSIEDDDGNKVLLDEDKARKVYENLSQYFEEDIKYVERMREPLFEEDSGQPELEDIHYSDGSVKTRIKE